MCLDGHIGGCVGHASEAETLIHLVVVQEGLITLVNAAIKHLASAAGARASSARVGELDAILLSLVQDVDVLWALNDGLTIWGLQGHFVVRRHIAASDLAAQNRWHCTGGDAWARDELALLVDGLRCMWASKGGSCEGSA
eukprot:CAMPEP_0178400946 /NCGR_PEP_ID=MMETSP0689_2-20121128/16049_1 /TAXON_ID=160604 /ORGANISM="Amphidinium massartii, Strain CS-259" /LENGTH=139 /DNA_ID=CAMNT_0020021753 /DNA_START=192 /DNA_END=611 /DNA_ORIENTATION=-